MPTISILIAARNESENIIACLEGIAKLSYPKQFIEILVGNDASEDNTASLIETFIENKPHFQLFNITNTQYNLKGKANVLAQLADKATGDYFFFTDADTIVPENWIENILRYFKENVGIVTGITTINATNFFAAFQGLEWLFALAFIRILSLFNIPMTGMGNNMAISKTAYRHIGGYEKVGFSIVEDYALFRAIVDAGFGFVQLFDGRILAFTKPIANYKNLLVQRKRWMRGAMSLSIGYRLNLYLNALLLPLLIGLYFISPLLSISIFIIHYSLSTSILAGSLSWLNLSRLFWFLPFFWFYQAFTNFVMLLHYLIVKDTVWKGRVYEE